MLRLAVSLAVMLFLAGCTAPEEGVDPIEKAGGTAEGGEDPGAGAPARTVFRHPLDRAHERVLWQNGSFAPTDACALGGCVTGGAQQRLDLTAEVPEGIPTRILVDLRYDTDAVMIGGLSPNVLLENGVFYEYQATNAGSGHRTIDTTLRSDGGTVAVAVYDFFPRLGATEYAYTLQVSVQTPNETVRPGVPVEVALESGQWFRVEPLADTPTRVTLYGPDDDYLATHTFEGPLDLQAATVGPHVLVAGSGAGVRVTTNGSASPLRTLDLVIAFGDARPPETSGETKVSFDVVDHPLAAGVYLASTDTHGTWSHTADETLRLDGPDGTLVEGVFSCTVCLNVMPDAVVFALGTLPGDGLIGPGAHTAIYGWQGSFGLEVGSYTVHYTR